MKARVLGIQHMDYVSKKTGNPVVGATLHCAFRDAEVFGEAVDDIFVSQNLGLKAVIDNITVGTLIDIEYNNRGFINNVAIVSTDKPANPADKSAKPA